MSAPSTHRFSATVENYIRYRPGYPAALLDFMRRELGLQSGHVIADIGSGTGKLAELLLPNGNRLYGVEPNGPMREAAERLLGAYPNFNSVAGTAEQTTLPGGCADVITVAQAFHWFDVPAFKEEARRIGRPEARVLLIWNNRVDAHSPFMEAYEQFLQGYSTDYRDIDLRHINAAHFDAFFGPDRWQFRAFPNAQHFGFDGLWGRYQSCSYALPPGHERHDEAREALRELFDRSHEAGRVAMQYETEVYFGRVDAVDG